LYFGKSVTQLNVSESALLAAVGQAPALNPIDAPQAAEQRRVETLQAMLDQGLITPDETSQAIINPPASRTTLPQTNDLAPAFTTLVLAQLDAFFGAGRVERGGLDILTSMDYTLQLQTVCATQAHLNRLGGNDTGILAADGSPCDAARLLPALQSSDTTNGSGAIAGALLLDPRSGQVLAAAGDLDLHPAGTTVSPFIYLTGFSRGLNPATLAWDIPGSTPDPAAVYHGPVRLRTALANDYIPPARGVLDQMGLDSVRTIASSFGLNLPSGLLTNDFDIAPLTLAGAYGIFADGGTQAGQSLAGTALQPAAVLQVTGVDHAVWANWTTPEERLIVSPQLAYLMNNVLSDEAARWPSLGHPNPLEIGRPAGAKTSRPLGAIAGDSLDTTAAWVVGYTPQRVVVVWLDVSKSTSTAVPATRTGTVRLAADLWHALMQYAVRDLPTTGWEVPSGIVSLNVCDPSGMLPTDACPNIVSETFLDGRQPAQADTLNQTFQVNRETGLLATVFTPPELVEGRVYMVVPPEARAWAQAEGIALAPTAYDSIQNPRANPDVRITSPAMFSDGHGKIEIIGSAGGADFASYRLEYGQGLYPQAWYEIGASSATPVTEGLLAEWDTTGLDGLYALRLMVVRADKRVDEAVVQVTLDNTLPQVAITYPATGQEIRLADQPQVALQAQVNDAFLLKVEFYVDDVLVGESDTAPFGVVWQASAGSHTLKVVATDRAGNQGEAEIMFSVK
jgi:membrane peptidoglycan carboxypeptidase